jgi:hypothetical protein
MITFMILTIGNICAKIVTKNRLLNGSILFMNRE